MWMDKWLNVEKKLNFMDFLLLDNFLLGGELSILFQVDPDIFGYIFQIFLLLL